MQTENLIVVPRGNPKDPREAIQISLNEIRHLESRQEEISRVNKTTAPELAKTFAYAWRELSTYAAWVEAELNAAKHHVNKTRAGVMLDKAPDILAKKGLRATESHLQAVCDMDESYQQAIDRRDQISAYLELLKVKAKAFEMAYQSAKKVMADSNGRPDFIGRELNGMAQESATIGDTLDREGRIVEATVVKTSFPGMGKARY